jgi:hypothetical protein
MSELDAIGDQLRSKIGGKFQITATLAGFCFTTISIQLTFLFQPQPMARWLPESIAVMFAALVLYCWGLYRLDALTMPKLFWSEGNRHDEKWGNDSPELTRDNLWALKHRMVFYWMRFTLGAIVLTSIGLVLLMIPAPGKTGGLSWQTFIESCVAILCGIAYCIACYCWERRREKTDKNFGKLVRFID